MFEDFKRVEFPMPTIPFYRKIYSMQDKIIITNTAADPESNVIMFVPQLPPPPPE